MQQEFKRINRSFEAGSFGQNLIYAMTAAVLFFLTEGAGFSAATIGTLLLVIRIYGLIVDPIIAVAIEKTNTKWGKYKPYIVCTPPIISILFMALFFRPNLSQESYLVYVYVITILFWTVYAFFDISFWSVFPAISKDGQFRLKLIRNVKMAALFAVTGYGVVNMPLVGILGQGSYLKGFFLESVIYGSIFLISGILVARELLSNEAAKDVGLSNCYETKDKISKKNNKLKLSEMLKALFANSPLITVIGAKLLIYTSLGIKGGLTIYYYKFSLGSDKLTSIPSLVSLPVTLIILVVSPMLIKKFGNKKTMSFSLGISVILSLIYIFNMKVPYFYVVIDGLSDALSGLFSLVITNMVTSTVEYGEWKTNIRLESMTLATNTISSKLTSGISAAISGWILTGIGYVPGKVQSAATLSSLHNIMVWVPVIGCTIAIVILSKYKFTSEMYKNIVKEIETRKQEKIDILDLEL